MSKKPTFEQFRKDWVNLTKFPNAEALAKNYGVAKRTALRWAAEFKAAGHELPSRKPTGPTNEPAADSELDMLERLKYEGQIDSLKRDLKDAQKRALTSQKMVDLIHEIRGQKFLKLPNWLKPTKKSVSMRGIPFLMLSDLHFDEIVDPSQVNFVNAYDRDIAEARIKRTFQVTIDLLSGYFAKPSYEGIVIALGGDLTSGNIHEELSETNNGPILRSVVDLTQLLIQGIMACADKFGKVFVPCVVGNHGRIHTKKRVKNKVFDNYEWLIYQYLAKHFADDPRISFMIPDGPDAVFKIYGKTFLLTHGDQFRGGSGISGIMTPLHLGLHRKQKKQAAIHQPFDVMALGHFHQYIHTNSLVVNGSMKGYCEFANENNFPYEPPQQALFINHAEHGMVFRTPVFCDPTDFEPQKQSELFK